MSVYSPYTKKYQNPNPISEKTLQITAAKEEEKKIASMGLGELKDFACPKALQHKKDWYMTCVSCDGVNNCKPGRRVMEILENDTKPEEKVSAIDKFNNRYNEALKLCGKEAYLDAIQHEDPVQYYMDVHHVPRSSALERFRRWKINYPDVQMPVIEKKPRKNGGLKAEQNTAISDKARALVEAAFTYPDGVFAYFINELHITIRATIRGRVYNWVNAYPDLDKKYRIKTWIEKTRGVPGKTASFDEPEGFLPNVKPEKYEKPESDDISVDEFLAEMDEKVPAEPVKAEDYGKEIDPVEEPEKESDSENDNDSDTVEAEAKIQDKKAEAEKELRSWRETAIEKKEDRDKQNRIAACLVFSQKRKEIAKTIDEIEMNIRQYQKRLSELQDDLVKLDSAAKILGFVVENPVATDGFLMAKHHDYGV